LICGKQSAMLNLLLCICNFFCQGYCYLWKTWRWSTV